MHEYVQIIQYMYHAMSNKILLLIEASACDLHGTGMIQSSGGRAATTDEAMQYVT